MAQHNLGWLVVEHTCDFMVYVGPCNCCMTYFFCHKVVSCFSLISHSTKFLFSRKSWPRKQQAACLQMGCDHAVATLCSPCVFQFCAGYLVVLVMFALLLHHWIFQPLMVHLWLNRMPFDMTKFSIGVSRGKVKQLEINALCKILPFLFF